MIRDIVTYDVKSRSNPKVLTTLTRKVTDFSAEETVNCIRDLNDTLDELIRTEGNKRGAIGLSATQIGVDLAISAVQLGDRRYVFVNPEVTEQRGKDRLFRIGCFSLYEYRAMVRYNDDVTVSYLDENGDPRTVDLKGDRSCVVQHEMDHLEGMLLFDRARLTGGRLFVPRESKYRDGKVPLKNCGLFAELRRRAGCADVQSAAEYYSSLFNDYTDLAAYAAKAAAEHEDLLKKIKAAAPDGSRILEVGNGIGFLSAALAGEGYSVACVQTDPDMADMAARVCEACGARVKVFCSSPLETDGFYSAVFACEVLDELEDRAFRRTLAHLASLGDRVVLELPTVWEISNALRGSEHLRTVAGWKKLIERSGCGIEDCYVCGHGGSAVFTVKRKE